MTDDSMRIVLCGCASCPVRDAGFKPESYRGETLCFGPWMIVEGRPRTASRLPIPKPGSR
jgi:hypothetical protein